jgi:XTP/dITP diphosphohydrolase
MPTILIATSNAGKLRDFAGVAGPLGVTIRGIPNFQSLPEVIEDGVTFEANARKKAAAHSMHAPGEIVLADDSGLEVDALNGAPGVHSARYAAMETVPGVGGSPDQNTAENGRSRPSKRSVAPQVPEAGSFLKSSVNSAANSSDAANNTRLLRELAAISPEQRSARFVCVLAAARDGEVLAVFSAEAQGVILDAPQGIHGFGYDPLFFFPQLNKTFAELTPEEKAEVSHRGAAFRKFLEWHRVR